MLNKVKAGMANIALKFISVEEKISYMFLETFPKNIRPIVILPAVNTCMKLFLSKLENKTVHGLVVNGRLNNVDVSVIQTNMGSPGAAAIMEVLKLTQCKVAIRVDFCGGLKTTLENKQSVETGLEIGSVVIPKNVFLSDGTSLLYLQEYANKITNNPMFHENAVDKAERWSYPNLHGNYWSIDCNDKIFALFKNQSGGSNQRSRVDTLWSSDSLFCENADAMSTWKSYGCNSVDMESSAIYMLGALFNIPVISLLGVSDLSDSDEYNLFKVNKIHPGMLKSLNDVYNILLKNLPKIHAAFVENPK
jgi:nucleoside phosphorylase